MIEADDLNLWNYRIIRYDSLCDDGPILGMGEAYYTDHGDHQELQVWSAEPFWTEQDLNNFAVTIDKIEADLKKGIIPDWAEGLTVVEVKQDVKMMRHAVTEPVIDERTIFTRWGE